MIVDGGGRPVHFEVGLDHDGVRGCARFRILAGSFNGGRHEVLLEARGTYREQRVVVGGQRTPEVSASAGFARTGRRPFRPYWPCAFKGRWSRGARMGSGPMSTGWAF